MIKYLRAERGDGARLDFMLDLADKSFVMDMYGVPDAEADRLEALGRQLADIGNIRDALIALRSLGYTLWLQIDEPTMQFLIREELPK